MSWLFLSLFAPLSWAVSNVIDQFLVRDEFGGAPWLYTFFQGTFYLPLICLFPFFVPQILDTPWRDATVLMAVGLTWIAGVGFYVTALKGDDASVAVPIFNLAPFINLVAARIFLGETMTAAQIVAGSVLVFAATAITWDFHTKKLRFRTVLLMLTACGAYLTYGLVARHQVATLHWATVYFWYGLGFSLSCVLITVLRTEYRRFFITFLRMKSRSVIALCVGQSWLDVLALCCVTQAIVTAPSLPMVTFVTSIQPLYVLAATGLAARFRPDLFTAWRMDRTLVWKIACILLMLAALYGLLIV
jgi:drug/metabolite transporter (DMT)-like permease